MRKFEYVDGITHSGVFHADEVFTTAAVKYMFNSDFKVRRLPSVPESINTDNTFVYDIGGGEFDHHQKGGNGCRENGVPYSSFGLFWKEFAAESFLGKFVAEEVDRVLVQGIDAVDTGYIDNKNNVNVMNVSNVISLYNPDWNEKYSELEEMRDLLFDSAVDEAIGILELTIERAINKEKAIELVKDAIENSYTCSGSVVNLGDYKPWQETVIKYPNYILYVVFKGARSGYNVQAVPEALGSFETRKPFPQSWRGLRDKELQEITGVKDAIFCHNTGFICGAESEEGALELARLAVEA